MILSGEFTVAAPREAVFAALRDANFFASCFEGVSALTETGENRYNALFETRVAYLKFKFKVTVELVRIEPPMEIEARIEGTPLGIVGRLTTTSITRLAEAGNETQLSYTLDTSLTGKLGSIGQSVLKSKAREMEKQFAERLSAAFANNAAPAGLRAAELGAAS